MIKCIEICNEASFTGSPSSLDDLRPINFIYGSNGTGKTTVSRIIGGESEFAECRVDWRGGRRLRADVLNSDFVKKNFGQFRGVFTLGEQETDTAEKIKQGKLEIDALQARVAQLRSTLFGDDDAGGKLRDLEQADERFRDRCWREKQKYDSTLAGAFKHYRGSRRKFMQKVLVEAASGSEDDLELTELERRAETVFGDDLSQEAKLEGISPRELLALEDSEVLGKVVVGRDDVDIAALITRLSHSDWVRRGLSYFEAIAPLCPFCQQAVPEVLKEDLEAYFDESFASDIASIDRMISEYDRESRAMQRRIEELVAAPGRFLEVEVVESQSVIVNALIERNRVVLEQKRREPSRPVALETIEENVNAIDGAVEQANVKIREFNESIENIAAERERLTVDVWQFVVAELDGDLAEYNQKRSDLEKAIGNIRGQIEELEQQISTKEAELRELESSTTSVRPAIIKINSILARFGFEGFKLAATEDEKFYRLVRLSGEDAQQTLSEGEKSFVVFLYFYFVLKGSSSTSGIATDRVAVFDDPVSSLDSDILFVVSSLIRGICEDVRAGRGYVRQVFVLSHNVHFHREVTFDSQRRGGRAFEYESFWILRRRGLRSTLERYDVNPIKTAYDLLWDDVRNCSPEERHIENILRRILEFYFKTLGSIGFDEIVEEFEGEDKLVCRALFSWLHSGSHVIHEDVFMAPSDRSNETFLRVFREIFVKTGHLAHYNMMMGDVDGGQRRSVQVG